MPCFIQPPITRDKKKTFACGWDQTRFAHVGGNRVFRCATYSLFFDKIKTPNTSPPPCLTYTCFRIKCAYLDDVIMTTTTAAAAITLTQLLLQLPVLDF